MTEIKEIKLVDVKTNSNIINKLNNIYKLGDHACSTCWTGTEIKITIRYETNVKFWKNDP